MQRDSMVDNPMISYTEPKQIKQPIDESDLAGLKKAADLLEEITDDMNSDLAEPFRAELWKVLDSMNAKIEQMERANSNPFGHPASLDMIRYAEKVCGRR